MLGYFIRRLAGGALLLLATAFLLHTYAGYGPAGVSQPPEGRCGAMGCARIDQMMQYNEPWPLSFVLWLFEPGRITEDGNPFSPTPRPAGVDFFIGGLRVQGAGVLVGDFGTSATRLPGVPVSRVLGGAWLLAAVVLGVTLLSVLLVTLQRWGRPWPHRAPVMKEHLRYEAFHARPLGTFIA